jgi:hypothetical protein
VLVAVTITHEGGTPADTAEAEAVLNSLTIK